MSNIRPSRLRYTQFSRPETTDERDAVRAHFRWLLANMDYFAQRGAAQLQTASLAMQRDLAMLGLSPQPEFPDAAELAERFVPPDAKEVAAELANIQRQLGEVDALVQQADLLIGDWGRSRLPNATVTPEIEQKSRKDARFLLTRARRIMGGMPQFQRQTM